MKAVHQIRAAALLVWLSVVADCIAAEPIVIGQSLPLSNGSYTGRRVLAGAEAYVRQVNATGGVNGRLLKLLTLDDGGDPQRYAANLRSLAASRVVTILNCVGDRACRAAVPIVAELHIPLVGPMSGSRAVRAQRGSYVFPVRPGYEQEATMLAQQLRTIGTSTLAILTQKANEAEPVSDLIAATSKEKIAVTPIQVAKADAQSLAQALSKLALEDVDAVAFDLDEDAINALASQSQQAHYKWPRMLLALGSTPPTVIATLFRDRMIGFTSVVPNPETSSKRLALELVKLAETMGAPEAVSFEGLEAFLNTKVCVEALRRAGAKANSERIAFSLETLRFDAGDFPILFGHNRIREGLNK